MGSGYTLRAATPADAGRVTELLAASYPVLMGAAYDGAVLAAALPVMAKANPALLRSGTFYLAETGEGGIAGCGGWTAERPGTGELEPGLAHLRHFGTHPQWSGRGVGRAIYNRCAKEARAGGAKRLECHASLNAEGFYAALGFTTVGRMEIPMGGVTMPCLVMRRDI